MTENEAFTRSWGRLERFAVSPAGIRTLLRMLHATDVRHVLPVVRVPTLIIHRRDDQVARIEAARFMAERVPNARLVELPGVDHVPWIGDTESILGEIEEFVTGARRGPEADRILATILFTDICASTERLATLGDRRWRDLLDAHHSMVRTELQRFRGQEIDTAGDGFLAAFDGPARAIRCALAIADGAHRLGIEIRAGLHTGECELMAGKLGGIAVHVGARVMAFAAPGETVVSSTVRDLVAGSGMAFEPRGTHPLKGLPGEWALYRVVP
jgi:class 3 adenylate cyclase